MTTKSKTEKRAAFFGWVCLAISAACALIAIWTDAKMTIAGHFGATAALSIGVAFVCALIAE